MDGGEPRPGQGMDRLDEEVAVLKAMAEPTRLSIIKALLDYGELSVTEICEAIDFDMSGISHHLSALKSANVVGVRRQGKFLYYSVANQESLARMLELLGKYVGGERGAASGTNGDRLHSTTKT